MMNNNRSPPTAILSRSIVLSLQKIIFQPPQVFQKLLNSKTSSTTPGPAYPPSLLTYIPPPFLSHLLLLPELQRLLPQLPHLLTLPLLEQQLRVGPESVYQYILARIRIVVRFLRLGGKIFYNKKNPFAPPPNIFGKCEIEAAAYLTKCASQAILFLVENFFARRSKYRATVCDGQNDVREVESTI